VALSIVSGRNDGYPCVPEISDAPSTAFKVPYFEYGMYSVDGSYPIITKLPDLRGAEFTPPFHEFQWLIMGADVNDGYPVISYYYPKSGAFMNAVHLEKVRFPMSLQKIGEFAFTNTALKSVQIPENCEYFPTSFPPDCIIETYEE